MSLGRRVIGRPDIVEKYAVASVLQAVCLSLAEIVKFLQVIGSYR